MKQNNSMKVLLFLNLLLMIYSLSGVCSKIASNKEIISKEFILCYSVIIILLGLYAIGWQQIIKQIPLTLAYSNRAVTVIWGMIWGLLFFGEKVTTWKLVGAVLIVIGVVLYTKADQEGK